ncbi:putative UDP-glucose 6-dehydrogenase [Methanocella conradii HZ254]|uniref:UDP-glucose 6-dehydrogenase n=1 Tax=Methanocella conradii (strain DSM 24694 / JCM 17849 / CGMCC 1.5162 / HZ254) TaxID=1041930 RepID=H8I853_METCZ|nr:UDP-glucose/GDP-mannose dehydrogenase family protein [Methanocella conradii]AFD00871.1 putative UDP-glucose 6-dehydrogenase [Methanocella conradii HZ254]
MRISIIGTGYVGTVTGACFAHLGNEVICVDVDPKRVESINRGVPPIYEEGLDELLKAHAGKNLSATLDYDYAVSNSDVSFICVPTPTDESGKIDLRFVREASRSIGERLKAKDSYHVVVVKSTVVPQTTQEVVTPILEETSGKKAGLDFGVGMNPEFLREGKAVHDFMHPDRIVIGGDDPKALGIIKGLYAGYTCPILEVDTKTAEMIKYVSNAFLATKISFSNEVGNICKRLGIDTYKVMEGVGLDARISPYFLNSGLGFGGSCFPKDVKALIGKASEIDYEPILLKTVLKVNDNQPHMLMSLLKKHVPDLKDKRIAVLGLAFKNDTDDIRESRAIHVIGSLLAEGASVVAYDPMATERMKRVYPNIEYAKSADEALEGADACVIATEWAEFKKLDSFKSMRKPVVIDGRRMVDPRGKGIIYEGLCW